MVSSWVRGARVMRTRLVLAACLVGMLATATTSRVMRAQSSPASESFVTQSWTVRDGLPVNSVTWLLQSRDGYIWIATFDGLVRFDGARFTVFNAANSPGLPSNRIIELRETRDSSLWLVNEQRQLVRFRHGVFTHFAAPQGLTSTVRSLQEDDRGALWVGTDRGLGAIRGDRFVPVAVAANDTIFTIAKSADAIVVGTSRGRSFRVADDAVMPLTTGSELDHETVVAFVESANHTKWIGTAGSIWRWSAAPGARPERVARVLPTSPGMDLILSERTGEVWASAFEKVFRFSPDGRATDMGAGSRNYTFGHLKFDLQGRAVYSSASALHRDGRLLYSLKSRPDEPISRSTALSAMLIDREGSTWIGTQGAGLLRIKPATLRVYQIDRSEFASNVYAVSRDRAGDIWFASTDGDLAHVVNDRVVNHPFTTWSASLRFAFIPWIRSILHDQRGRLWLGTWGLFVCEHEVVRCKRPPGMPDGLLSTGSVLAMHEEPNGDLWFGTDFGLHRLQNEVWSSFSDNAPAKPVRAFVRTRDGALWMGTAGSGLSRFKDGRFRHVTLADSLPSEHIRSLYTDSAGFLWIGTEGRGLARLNPAEWSDGRRGHIASIRVSDGLYDDVIHQILEDDFGRFWFSSNRGISWVERKQLIDFADGRVATVSATSYTERDGMLNREGNGGSQPAGAKSRDGRLWFPTQNGVVVADPAAISRNRVPPPVAVEQVIASGTTFRASDVGLSLNASQRDLEIKFTAMSFLAPENVRFRYRLDPYDPDWVDAGTRRNAFYTRVPPGDYTFRVIASNNDGVWNEQGAAVSLHVAPRAWESTPFRILALLTLAAGAFVALRVRERRLRDRAYTLESLVDARTSELRERERQLASRNDQLADLHESRSRLFANLSHEFRTPLTLILGPLRSLLDGRHGSLSQSAKQQGDLMLRNGQRLLRLINQVLDLSRLQAGALSLEQRPNDLVAFARDTTQAFAALAERRGLALRFRSESPSIAMSFDAEQLEKVLLNLLSNALKFTEPGGTVDVSVNATENVATLVVRDTGNGIAAEQVPHIFERFYQADTSSTRRYEGTGVGLALAHELVALHGGTIAVDSVLGEGSTFTVSLPRRVVVPASQATGRTGEVTPDHVEAMIATADAETAPTPVDTNDDQTTVLIVDDNADVRAYVRSVLATSYRVIEAGDGRAGLDVARASLPDLIVADVMMPEMDGLSLGRALKGDPMTDAIPVVLLTARAAPEDQVSGFESGADAYLVKPFDPDVLEACVANLLTQRQRLRERFGDAIVSIPEPEAAAIDQKLRPIIEARIGDAALIPESLAADAAMSYHQMYRALRDELGVSPSRFIRGVRVECAAKLLRAGEGNVTEVAYSVGFESLSYFSRAFHERFGESPSAFLKSRK